MQLTVVGPAAAGVLTALSAFKKGATTGEEGSGDVLSTAPFFALATLCGAD